MSKRVEIEQKFYCTNNKKLTNLITENGLVKSKPKLGEISSKQIYRTQW